LVLGSVQKNWLSLVPLAGPAPLDWLPLGEGARLLAFGASQPLPTPLARAHSLDLGPIPSHWPSPVQIANFPEEQQWKMAQCEIVLVPVPSQQVLST
jgi:hypothetical protein